MSNAPQFGSDSLPVIPRWVGQQRRVLELPVRFVGFWTAVLGPFVLLAFLASGVAQQSPLLLTALLCANVVGLVVGRNYNQ